MIIISEKSFVLLGEDQMTGKKVKQGIVKFTTPSIGKVTGWVTFEDESGVEVTNGLVTEYEQSYFTGEKVDILTTLSEEFLIVLSGLNPTLTITVEI
jgi:hypothetical protein